MFFKKPLDYETPATDGAPESYDSPVSNLWWVRLANRRRNRRPGKLRLIYWVVMLTAIGVLLWYIRHMLQPYNDLMK
jgi:hypothetical protein